jgi:hypothetical protein
MRLARLTIGVAALYCLGAGVAQATPAPEVSGAAGNSIFRQAGPGPLVSPTPEPAAATAAPAAAPVRIELSNEWTLTRWAYVLRRTPVFSQPDSQSAVITGLRTKTHDGTPELVVALAQVFAYDGTWVEVRFKHRPNNVTGWVRRDDLGEFNIVNTALRIQLNRFKATLFRAGKRVWSSRVGIGKGKWPTPRGHFYARERLVPRNKDTVYGIFAFGTSATSPTLTDWPGGGIVGVHGTNQPELIPGRISHGCVRVPNRKIAQLKRLMSLGTPIEIV